MSSAARPITIRSDGSPLFPVEWAPLAERREYRPPARPRFPGGGQGAREGTTKTETPAPAQGRVAPRSGGDEGAILARGGMLGLGSPQAPPPRVPESATTQAKTTPDVTVYQ